MPPLPHTAFQIFSQGDDIKESDSYKPTSRPVFYNGKLRNLSHIKTQI